MEFQTISADDALTHVALSGRLDVATVGRIEDPFVFALTTRRAPAIVDLSAVEFLGSLGIGMFVGVAKALRRKGHELVLFAPQAQVRDTLEKAGIHLVLPVVDDEAAARARLAAT